MANKTISILIPMKSRLREQLNKKEQAAKGTAIKYWKGCEQISVT